MEGGRASHTLDQRSGPFQGLSLGVLDGASVADVGRTGQLVLRQLGLRPKFCEIKRNTNVSFTFIQKLLSYLKVS